ncbi:citramalate synthase [Thermostichus vulcanus]|uniref:Citramalate synthase n=1 Tax=Thermostichus vulcanus str. 'Rupite' TaxID=2813851 RepID=A0ABT0C7I6_THEVL|nr:citramalate synthase [Thermostichus vulcanus]MCJ2541699.1 citramalate synthase [Thermostichus vulcanus str. 'Rupite']
MEIKSDHPTRVILYDTTLRDGAQREGLSLSVQDKLQIAKLLDRLGIPFIEGGWPGANPKDVQFFWQMREEPLTQAELVAFCSTRRPGRTAAEDPMLQAILAAGTRYVTVFGKSWDLHVTQGLGTSLEENLAMIRETLTYLGSQGRRVIYDAEHWFDAYRHNPDYALQTLVTAAEAGAEWLVLCDTNGGSLPHEIAQITAAVLAESHHLRHLPLGIHTHNDSGTAVANALAAVQAGVRMVQGTINGYGERCGNADLCSLIPNLQLKLGYTCLPEEKLQHLTEISRSISEVVNLAPDDHAPFVGLSAFAHKGGIHVSAVQKNPLTYEHIAPEQVGNCRRVVVSEQSGLSNILSKIAGFGFVLDKSDPQVRSILERLKTLELEGYQFEAAEASFELMVRELLGQRSHPFEMLSFNISTTTRSDWSSKDWDPTGGEADVQSLAAVKIVVQGQTRVTAAEGNGPVAALDGALRKALLEFYPQIEQIHLSDYKVRILNGQAGTSAKTRVLVEFSDGHHRWTTVGVSTNIIEASCRALVEGLEYSLLPPSSPLPIDYRSSATATRVS